MDLYADRLALRLSGMSPDEGRRLARLVAEALASSGTPGNRDLGGLRLELTARSGESVEATARRIAAGLLGAIARAP